MGYLSNLWKEIFGKKGQAGLPSYAVESGQGAASADRGKSGYSPDEPVDPAALVSGYIPHDWREMRDSIISYLIEATEIDPDSTYEKMTLGEIATAHNPFLEVLLYSSLHRAENYIHEKGWVYRKNDPNFKVSLTKGHENNLEILIQGFGNGDARYKTKKHLTTGLNHDAARLGSDAPPEDKGLISEAIKKIDFRVPFRDGG